MTERKHHQPNFNLYPKLAKIDSTAGADGVPVVAVSVAVAIPVADPVADGGPVADAVPAPGVYFFYHIHYCLVDLLLLTLLPTNC